MATEVYEMMSSRAPADSIREDGELDFPNMLDCLAIVAVNGGAMAGIHVTWADARDRFGAIGAALRERVGGEPVFYVAGNDITPYQDKLVSALRSHNIHAAITGHVHPIVVRFSYQGTVSVAARPNGTQGMWQRLQPSPFA